MAAKTYTISGFLSDGYFIEKYSTKRKASVALRKHRKTLSDHYYFGLQIAVIDTATGEILKAGNPKGKSQAPVVTSDVYVSHGGKGITYL